LLFSVQQNYFILVEDRSTDNSFTRSVHLWMNSTASGNSEVLTIDTSRFLIPIDRILVVWDSNASH